jgi:hypothetical protein
MLEKGDEQRYILDFIERSDKFRQPYMEIFDEVLDNYLVTFEGARSRTMQLAWNWKNSPMGGFSPTRSRRARLKDPETHQIVETLAAQTLGIIFGPRDYLQAVPIGSDDPEKARLIARVLMSVLEGPGVYRTLYQIFKDSFIFGTAIIEIGWDRRTQLQNSPMGPTPVTYKDEPLIRGVDIYDFYPDPSGTRIQQDMIGAAKRFRISKAQVLELSRPGPNGEPPVYDYAAVSRIIDMGRTRPDETKGNVRFNQGVDLVSQETGMFNGFEYYGNVPWNPQDGARNRFLTMLEGEVVRSSMNPMFDGQIPLKEVVVNPLVGRFYGLSPCEVIRFLQDSADNMLMVGNDAADMAAHAPLLVGSSFGGNPEQLRKRAPLDTIACNNPEAVMPVPVDLNALQFAMNDMMRRKMEMREASGATNPMQAIAGGDRQTATESSLLARYASQRVEMMAKIFEREDFPWIGRTLHSRIRQFAPPYFIATLQGEQFPVSLDQIDIEADVRFIGSLDSMTEMQKATNYEKGFPILSNPDLVMMFPDYCTRYLRDILKFPDAERIVAQAGQTYAMRMIAEQMQMVMGVQANPTKKASSATKQREENMGGAGGAAERGGEAIS